MGPGIARTDATGPALAELLAQTDVPAVLDADALNALAAAREALDQLARAMVPPLLTPHPAELARLLDTTTAEVQADRFAAATTAAQRFHAHVLLKGAGSVLAHPDGSLEVNPTGTPAMAAGGTGDVLAGVCGALVAQGLSAGDAGLLGMYVHGRAGELASHGRAGGLLAGELADAVPQALAELA
jgi:NAD(P)H-hydrate epimerase